MRAFVRLRLPHGQTAVLGPGDMIGRLATAALQMDDARISEAHAMVSLRGHDLKLLALRGLFAVDGKPLEELCLRPGLTFELARGIALSVEEVSLPSSLLAIVGDGLPQQILVGSCSLLVHPRPMLLPRYQGDADALLWDNGDKWRIRLANEETQDFVPGPKWLIRGVSFRAVSVALDRIGQNITEMEGSIHPPLTIVANFDTVHIHADGKPVVTLDGIAARIVSELIAVKGPASWELIAGQIWANEHDRTQLRRRWDISLARLRRKLKECRVRPDLIRAGGTGQVELLLASGDRVEDRV